MRDLDFLSGRFSEQELSKEQRYLLKYFKTELQRTFLKYFMVFGDWTCFIEHTGLWTTKSYLHRQEQRFHGVVAAHKQAKSTMDLDALWRVESGKYKP